MKSFKLTQIGKTTNVEIDGVVIKNVKKCEVKVAYDDLPMIALEIVNTGRVVEIELDAAEEKPPNEAEVNDIKKLVEDLKKLNMRANLLLDDK